KTINGLTITATGTKTLTIASGKTLTASNTLTFTGTDSSTVAFGSGGTVCYVGSCTGATVSDDSLDFDKFVDTMTLDATTTIDAGYDNGLQILSTLGSTRSTAAFSVLQPNTTGSQGMNSPLVEFVNSDTTSA